MKKFLLPFSLHLLISISTYSQVNNLVFDRSSNWKQLINKAKSEKKHIFIDIYATWCGPCKAMEKEVYIDKDVANFMNTNFICVKMQIDSTNDDDNYIKKWRNTAKEFVTKYNIKALPSYMFFSPEGKVVHKGSGYKTPSDFIILGQNAITPSMQYYTQLKKFKSGKLAIKDLPALAEEANECGDKELENEIATKYEDEYLSKLLVDSLLKRDNIDFYLRHSNIITSNDLLFKICRENPDRLDKIERKGLSNEIVLFVISKEEVDPRLWKNKQPITENPNWKEIAKIISNKYGEYYANTIISEAELYFYKRINNWDKYVNVKDSLLKISTLKPGEGMMSDASRLNTDAWEIFMKSDNPQHLTRAVAWSELSIKTAGENDPILYAYYDTKANLLYKIGKKEEAIEAERTAIKTYLKMTGKENKHYADVLEKMNNGLPTW